MPTRSSSPTCCPLSMPQASSAASGMPKTTFSLEISNRADFISGGYAADRLGRLNVLYPMVTLCGVLCLAMWLPARTPAVLVGFACVYGFASGIFISVMPAATGQITPTERLGARLGAFGSVTSVAFLTGTPIAGSLIRSETRAGYQPLIIFAVSLNALQDFDSALMFPM